MAPGARLDCDYRGGKNHSGQEPLATNQISRLPDE
jgi:hypothetical protein